MNKSTGIDKSFPLTLQSISNIVTKTSPGTYVLGQQKGDTFYVSYVGRSDSDLAERLKCWVGYGNYTDFKAVYYDSPYQAFLRECQIFHDFGGTSGLDNKIHPDRPSNTSWKCPVCDVLK